MPSVRFKRFKFVAILFQTEPCVQIFLAPKFRRKIIFFIEMFFFCLCLRLTTTQGYYHIQLSIVKLINFLHRRRLTAMKSDQLFKTSYNGSSAFVNLFLILYRRGLKLTFFIRQSWKPQVPWEWFANFGRTYVSEMPNVVLAETNFFEKFISWLQSTPPYINAQFVFLNVILHNYSFLRTPVRCFEQKLMMNWWWFSPKIGF